jgi:hypothetical protein
VCERLWVSAPSTIIDSSTSSSRLCVPFAVCERGAPVAGLPQPHCEAECSVACEVAPGHDELARRDRLHDEDQVRARDAARRERGLDAAEAGPRAFVLASLRRAAQAATGDGAGVDADRSSGHLDSPAADVLEQRIGRPRRTASERASARSRRSGRGGRSAGAGRSGRPPWEVRAVSAAARARTERRGDQQTGKQCSLHGIAMILPRHRRSDPQATRATPVESACGFDSTRHGVRTVRVIRATVELRPKRERARPKRQLSHLPRCDNGGRPLCHWQAWGSEPTQAVESAPDGTMGHRAGSLSRSCARPAATPGPRPPRQSPGRTARVPTRRALRGCEICVSPAGCRVEAVPEPVFTRWWRAYGIRAAAALSQR